MRESTVAGNLQRDSIETKKNSPDETERGTRREEEMKSDEKRLHKTGEVTREETETSR